MRKHIAFTLVVATLALVGCGSSQDSESKTGSDSLATVPATSSIDLAAPTTTVSATADTIPSATTLPGATATTTPSQTGSSQNTSPPATAAPKAPTPTQVPQMQLSGTPQEQASQVIAATEKVAAIPLSSSQWSSSLRQLNLSLVSYGVNVVFDPNEAGRNIYQITMGDQSACFLWSTNPDTLAKYLKPHSCS
jgi:hypothetical protein